MTAYIPFTDKNDVSKICDEIHQHILPNSKGYCVVQNSAMSADEFMKLTAKKVGESFTVSANKGREVLYDLVQDRGADISNSIISASNVVFPLHTDCCYLQRPADVVVLYCLENSLTGGESTLVNVNDIIPLLPSEYVAFLLTKTFRINMLPFKVLEYIDGIYNIRYQMHDMLMGCLPEEKADMESSLQLLTDILSDPANFTTVKLKKDECLIVNNRTCLHGRYGFEKGSKRVFLRSRNYL